MKEFEVRPKEYVEIQAWDECDELMLVRLTGDLKYTVRNVDGWFKVESTGVELWLCESKFHELFEVVE